MIKLREQAIIRADMALDAAWPERLGENYIHEMQWVIDELIAIISEMQAKSFDRVEQSRTFRLLGSMYADLEPALGKEMLFKAKQAYQTAEILLNGQSDEFEQAKLNFNFGNTLRQIDPNDIEQLLEAKQRVLAARAYFAMHAPDYLVQADAALQSLDSLLRIAPLVNNVKHITDKMDALQEQLATGDNVSEIAKKAQEIMKRGGGTAGIIGQLKTIIETLSDDQRQSKKFLDIQKQMDKLTRQIISSNEMTPEVKQIWSLLNDRLKLEEDRGTVSGDHAGSIRGVLEEFGRILSCDEKDVSTLLAKQQRMREFIDSKLEMNHYLSHDIERPPARSRASELVELNWQLRRYLLEELHRSDKGEEESKEALELSVRASRVDKQIYKTGTNNTRAMTIEKEELRPLGLAIRNFSARMNSMPARPIWRVANKPVDTNAVFYSGVMKEYLRIAKVCRRLGLEIMDEPKGESYASARWKQLQKAVTAIFDFRYIDGPDMAAINYELGISLTLGKPIVILIAEDQTLPFDVDIAPVVLAGGSQDDIAIATAIDRSVVWTYPRPRADTSPETLEYVLSLYPRPQQNVYVDQTLRILADYRNAPDPLAMNRTLTKLFDYLKDGETMLIYPWWSPVYPEVNNPRLFHVMPYTPQWADEVTAVTREVCKTANVKYVRGDEADEPNVIRSIWEEIAQATHVCVDLTGLSPNVALELGIAHCIGKKILIVGQGDPKLVVFKSISKFRVRSYEVKRIKETLGKEIQKFL